MSSAIGLARHYRVNSQTATSCECIGDIFIQFKYDSIDIFDFNIFEMAKLQVQNGYQK